MRFFADQRFLAIYSGVLTIVFVVTVLCGFAALRSQCVRSTHGAPHQFFVEPDGTPHALIISDRAEFPGICSCAERSIRGPDRRDLAGMLFINDEASEMGGLVWSGLKDKDGKVQESRPPKFRPVRAGSDFCD